MSNGEPQIPPSQPDEPFDLDPFIPLPEGQIVDLGNGCLFHLVAQRNSPNCNGGFLVGWIICNALDNHASIEVICVPKRITQNLPEPPTLPSVNYGVPFPYFPRPDILKGPQQAPIQRDAPAFPFGKPLIFTPYLPPLPTPLITGTDMA